VSQVGDFLVEFNFSEMELRMIFTFRYMYITGKKVKGNNLTLVLRYILFLHFIIVFVQHDITEILFKVALNTINLTIVFNIDCEILYEYTSWLHAKLYLI
jgi:hypothetical protein